MKGLDKEVETSSRGEYWRLLPPGTYSIQVPIPPAEGSTGDYSNLVPTSYRYLPKAEGSTGDYSHLVLTPYRYLYLQQGVVLETTPNWYLLYTGTYSI